MPPIDPALQRRRLRDRLRRLRESADFTQRQVADEMDWSPSKVIRIEAGSVGVSVTDLRALLQHYGVNDPGQVEELIAMARAAKSRPWWERYKPSVPGAPFLTYLSYEGNASILRAYSPYQISGLLQTEEYMREMFQNFGVSEEDADSRAELRLERQERMLRADGPKLNFILDEGCLRRPVRSAGAMKRQIEHILRVTENPNVKIRIIRFTHGIHPNCSTPYVLLEFESPEEDMVLYLEEQETVKEGLSEKDSRYSPPAYLESFFSLEQVAPTDHTCDLLQDVASSFS